MNALSNPVIFISLGQGAAIWQHLSPALNEYTKGIAYVEAPASFDDLSIKREIGRIWKQFLELGQTADIVRVNYLLTTDEAGVAFPTLRQTVEKYLSALYPAGILTDIYCILDDDMLLQNDDSRRSVMSMLKTQQAEDLNIYLLSNLTSQNMLIPIKATAHTIAMLTLFKDCAPEVYVTGADASRYNELYFLDNCYGANGARHGRFLTASSLHVTIPKDGLKAILISELLTFGKDAPVDFGDTLDESFFAAADIAEAPVKPLAYVQGMVIPDIKLNRQLTRGQWVAQLFGQRLDLLMETGALPAAAPAASHVPDFAVYDVNFYDLLRHTNEDGIYGTYAAAALADAKNILEAAEENMQVWLNNPPALAKGSPEAEKRRLSPLVVQDLWPYIIAHKYMEKHAAIRHQSHVVHLLQNRQQHVRSAHQELLHLQTLVQGTIDKNAKKIKALDDTFSPFSPAASAYFRKLFKDYAEANHQSLAALSTAMTTALVEGSFPQYLKKLDSYIHEHILPSSIFNKPIMDTLNDLVSTGGHGDISGALGEWVFNHRMWDIRLKTGYAGLHTEINLFMPAQGAADVKRRYEERGLGRMNLFADETANHVAVLYHAGAFEPEDLFYESLYAEDFPDFEDSENV